MDTPDPTGTAVGAITYTNVGATGSYDRVVTSTVAPSCVPNVCDKTATPVSGPLVPFDEEMTMVFSGPMDLYQVAAYSPSGGGDYQRVAYWDRCTTDGLAFVGNKQWYQCNGYVQSYVTADGTMSSPTPVQFGGHLDPGVGVNVMTSTLCSGTTDGTDCGFSRGLALHGFKGDAAGSKIFATKFRMPIGNVTPAYWILPAQVVRSAQYGCNCRGEGGMGGCGELDVAEVLGGATSTPPHPEQATTTIYSFQGVTNGGTSYFQRPVYVTATFLVIFDAPSSSIALRRLGATDFDFGGTIPASLVQQWLVDMGTVRPMP
jgi:Cell wall protein YJL171C/Tos1, C-terminal/Cell wall protein YJL171C/Tos1, N-terminal